MSDGCLTGLATALPQEVQKRTPVCSGFPQCVQNRLIVSLHKSLPCIAASYPFTGGGVTPSSPYISLHLAWAGRSRLLQNRPHPRGAIVPAPAQPTVHRLGVEARHRLTQQTGDDENSDKEKRHCPHRVACRRKSSSQRDHHKHM